MIIASGKTRAEAWLDAISKLQSVNEYNVIVEIEQPCLATPQSREIDRLVNDALVAHNRQPLVTVADTIFPMTEYVQGGMEQVYEYPKTIYPNIKAENPWGTYALRLVERVGANGETYYPLKTMIEKMRGQLYPKPGGRLSRKRCFYELDAAMPTAELKLYEAEDDKDVVVKTQCLSHLSFKLGIKDTLYLTALYRSQYFVEKALGNYRGLAALQAAVARELGLRPGPLVVHATYATLDSVAVGGAQERKNLVARALAVLA